jgi:hypothetical protein
MTEPKKCTCGRSPTGICIGWHSLSKPAFLSKLQAHERKQIVESAKKRRKLKNDNTSA